MYTQSFNVPDSAGPTPGLQAVPAEQRDAELTHQVARVTARPFDLINGPLLRETMQHGQTQPDWAAFFASQLQLGQQLLALAQQYRRAQHDDSQPELGALLQEFARPPLLHSHYALTLARLLELGLGQQQLTQGIFEQLLRPAP